MWYSFKIDTLWTSCKLIFIIIYKYIHMDIYMFSHQPTFFWQSICSSLIIHALCEFHNALFHFHGLTAADGKRIFKIVSVSDKWIKFFCVCASLEFAVFFYYVWCSLRSEGLLAVECRLSGFDSSPCIIIIAAVKRNVVSRKFSLEAEVGKAPTIPSFMEEHLVPCFQMLLP